MIIAHPTLPQDDLRKGRVSPDSQMLVDLRTPRNKVLPKKSLLTSSERGSLATLRRHQNNQVDVRLLVEQNKKVQGKVILVVNKLEKFVDKTK